MELSAPAFTTRRLNVFRVDLTPTPWNARRKLFLGFRRDADWPILAASATTAPCPYRPGVERAEMFETSDLQRRRGLARELWLGIEAHLGRPLEGTPLTAAGAALIGSVNRDRTR